jgi:carboxyl-terminal processing protease
VIHYPQPVLTINADGTANFVISSLEGDLKTAVRKGLESANAKGVKKLLIDLRRCATGKPGDGVEMAQWFLEKGDIGSSKGQRIEEQRYAADAAKQIWKKPVVLLVNRGTAGAAEVFAAALLENKRAQVVGERTYGNAAIQRALSLDDGSAVILSVAKYYAPNGKAIQDTGVTPNHPLNDTLAGPATEDPESEDRDETNKTLEDIILKKGLALLLEQQ